MAEHSSIAWCDATFNPWIGCSEVSPACDHCYAREFMTKKPRWATAWSGDRFRTSAANWAAPLRWNLQAAATGIRRRVFCASLADVFDDQVDPQWRDDLWGLVDSTPSLDWLLLTKRPQNIVKMLPAEHCLFGEPWPNVWLGATVENQEEADQRIMHLLASPAKVHFLSCEPLLEKLDLSAIPLNPGYAPLYAPLTGNWWFTDTGMRATIGWVICGGESGRDMRPMQADWARSLRDQCSSAGVPFFMKQMNGKSQRSMEPIPDDLMIREFPSRPAAAPGKIGNET